MENTNEMKYSMELKNFYWNIMISPKCRELVSLIEAYSNQIATCEPLSDKYYDFTEEEKVMLTDLFKAKYKVAKFIEKNIDLKRYSLERYNDYNNRLNLAFELMSMYNDDI